MSVRNERLDDYLNAVCRQIRIPCYAMRVRRELRDHIVTSALAVQAQERISADAAMEIAIRRMGDPAELGRRLAVSYKPVQRFFVFLLCCVAWAGIVYCIISVLFAVLQRM